MIYYSKEERTLKPYFSSKKTCNQYTKQLYLNDLVYAIKKVVTCEDGSKKVVGFKWQFSRLEIENSPYIRTIMAHKLRDLRSSMKTYILTLTT